MKELVEQFDIETQEELADKLKEAGYTVTQATISRDIRELKLSKIPMGDGRQKYAILAHSDHYLGEKYIRVLKDGFCPLPRRRLQPFRRFQFWGPLTAPALTICEKTGNRQRSAA